ncbi:hypothetical protein ASD79_19095 [Caulobacter sp. Root655]|uniref:hypothetical protein n=1 Tax=Caulobacter sp. Root655 TaxID=1736578 RepID=UPI0006FE5240|nr:hypothetical protein [Caulobacter sp. Root655]KRA65042.1 hypothetical protein ASD79_19095 [Caulobacter sp. Root655]
MITFDSSLLLGYYQAKSAGQAAGATASSSSMSSSLSSSTKKTVPNAPWTAVTTEPSDMVKGALNGRKFVDEGAAVNAAPTISGDYKKLFATYQALNTLSAIANRSSEKNVTDSEIKRLQAVFSKGLNEVNSYIQNLSTDGMRVTTGAVMTSDKSSVGVPKNNYGYVTGKLYSGKVDDVVPTFAGAVSFTMAVKKFGVSTNLTMDLSEMGATPRTMANVVSFFNSKLDAAGFDTTFAVERTVGQERTTTVNGQTVKLPATGDDFALRIRGDSTEALTFTAPAPKPAVYITTAAGNPDPDKKPETEDAKIENTLVKYGPGTAGQPGTKIFSDTLEGTVANVHKTMTGPDGSLYVLADVDGAASSQTIKGEQDVALLKYDSAGKLLYARTLGAADTATGYNMAISADGQVAIAGSVSGQLSGATNGPINSDSAGTVTDSFVTLYDAKGDETWTVRRGGMLEDEATAVAFGQDGVVYVGGRTKSDMPGSATGATAGGYDSYLTGFATDIAGTPKALFTTHFGSAENDTVAGIVVNGSQVVVASKEGSEAMLRSFNVATTVVTENRTALNDKEVWVTAPVTYTKAATLTTGATRDLGSLKGGNIAGLTIDNGQLYVGGSTTNGALTVNNKTAVASGGSDGFAARVSLDLTSTAQDALAYYGGTGDDTVTGMAVSNGQVWLVGSAGKDLAGQATVGDKDGYVAQMDVATGAVSWQQRLTGKDGYATPTSIAVDASGASSLDVFGLPRGTMDFTQSQKIVSATSARAGDTFQIRTRARGTLTTIKIDANDTLETLGDKIRKASGFAAKVEYSSSGNSRSLRISPSQTTSTIEILAGKGGTDVLEALGLKPGIVRNTKIDDGKTVSADGKGPIYGLSLDTGLDLTDDTGRKLATAAMTKAIAAVRLAYREMADAANGVVPADTSTGSGKTGGTVPTYLTNQIANYQAALNRLTGG